MLIEILTFSFMKMRLKVSSAKWRQFCLGLNVLRQYQCGRIIKRSQVIHPLIGIYAWCDAVDYR